jgi:hypothetical protein
VLKNFFNYVDDLESLVNSSTSVTGKISAKEFKELLNKITGDKVRNCIL